MKTKTTIFQDYYGAFYYLESNEKKELIIFIVDDNDFYLQLLKAQLNKNEKFAIYTFSSGEECLNYLDLNPDIVIIDYHLDGTHSHFQKGDVIAQNIRRRLPEAEIIIISSDHELALTQKNELKFLFKDAHIKDKVESTFVNINNSRTFQKLRNVVTVFTLIICIAMGLLFLLNF